MENVAGDPNRVQIFRLTNPPQGTADVEVDIEGTEQNKAAIGVLSFNNVDQNDPTGTTVTNTGETTSSTISVSSETDDLVVDVVGTDKLLSGPGSGQTLQWTALAEAGKESGGSTAAGASSVDMSWTLEESGKFTHVGFNVNAAGDTTPPDLSAAQTDDATGDGTVDEITTTFTESVTDASVTASDFSLSTGTVDSVSTGATADDDTVVLAVSGLPTDDTAATPDVTLGADSVTDLAGNTGPSTDTTITASDGAAPVLVSTTPTDDATGVDTETDLTATFSEAVVAGSGNVELRQSADDSVFETIGITDSGKVSFSGDTVTIDPNGTLSGSTGYYVLIDGTAIEDPSANVFGGVSDKAAWNFETADTAAPTVTVDQPNGDERLSGGSVYEILWTAPDDDGIATDGIDLSYSADSGTTWTSISTGEANDGTFDWTVPTIDSKTVLVRVEATDTTGNTGQDVSDSTFTIESPEVDLTNAKTKDPDRNGTIEHVTVKFSDAVDDGSLTTDAFTVAGATVTAIKTGAMKNDDTSVLRVNGLTSNDTSVTPHVTLTANGVTDLSGNTGPSTDTTVRSKDRASPVIVSARTGDADGDGHLDRVALSYSEGIPEESTVAGDYDVGGTTYANESIVADDDGDDTLVFGVSELEEFDTDATPSVGYERGSTADAAGNLVANATFNGTTDGAAPVLVSTFPADDAIDVHRDAILTTTFSEPVTRRDGSVEVWNGDTDTLFREIDVSNPEQVSIQGATVRKTVSTPFEADTAYYVLINATAIGDAAGDAYAGLTTPDGWNFRTGNTTLGSDSPLKAIAVQTGSADVVDFRDVLRAISAFNEDTTIVGFAIDFTDVLDAIEAFNEGTPV